MRPRERPLPSNQEEPGDLFSLLLATGLWLNPTAILGFPEMEGGGPNNFCAIGRTLNGETNGKNRKRSEPPISGNIDMILYVRVLLLQGLSQLETAFSPMNMDLCPWVAAIASDHQEPQFIQFCNALKDLASNCVQEFSEDRPHMANVQQTLRQLNRQILNR